MGKKNFILKNESGAVLLTTLMIMFIVTLIALTLNNTTTTDIIIASNDKNYKAAFYNSDSGISVSSRFLEALFMKDFEGGDLSYNSAFKVPEDDFEAFVNDFEDILITEGEEKKLSFEVMESDVDVKMNYKERKHLAGSENSFKFLYNFDSEGEGPGNSSANITAGYRHIEHF
ncbi:MAG: pilus assembly PilX N-terminal domain-containing protein [Candidatus Muiribacteriota bacterium]